MRKGEFEFCDQVEQFDPRLGEIGRRDFVYRFGKGVGKPGPSHRCCSATAGWLPRPGPRTP